MHTTADPAEGTREWRSRLAATLWGLSTAALVVCGSCLVYATAVEVHRLTRTLPARPPEVVRDVVVRNAPDHKGRRASFRILLFSDEFRWRINSYAALESTPAQPAFTTEMRTVLNDAQEIICVGASSEEIPNGVSFEQGRIEEERRAGRRSRLSRRQQRAQLAGPGQRLPQRPRSPLVPVEPAALCAGLDRRQLRGFYLSSYLAWPYRK